jgi:hypothetical protein
MSEQVKPADAELLRLIAEVDEGRDRSLGGYERQGAGPIYGAAVRARLRALADILASEENEWALHAEIRCELFGVRCHRPGHACASFSPDHPHVARCTDFNVSEGPE